MIESGKQKAFVSRFKSQKDSPNKDNFWRELNLRIREKKVIPIIGNSVRNDRIFDIDGDHDLGIAQEEAKTVATWESVDEELTKFWAEEIKYPFPDNTRLARVSTYNQIKSRDAMDAKTKYLNFLKRCLLDLAEADKDVAPDLIEDFRRQLDTLSFAHIAWELGYPKFPNGQVDPLHLLARLPLPIYITTSYYDFLERALRAANKSPHTQICAWSDEAKLLPHQYTNSEFEPTENEPLVYHLHGFEQFPETLVLSEDDYMEFLVRVAKDTSDSKEQVIPLYLRGKLAGSSLILLGYRLQDWDFRVLFRGVIKSIPIHLQKYSVAVQLDPEDQSGITDPQEAKNYLQKYFAKDTRFEVKLYNTDRFINMLWQEWDEWRRSQG